VARSPPTSAPALAALTAARTDVDQPLSPDAPQDLAGLEAAAKSYGYGYHGRQHTRVLADLVDDFASLAPLLAVAQPAPVRAAVPHGRTDGGHDRDRLTRPGQPHRVSRLVRHCRPGRRRIR
jgi:hypothetical protein